MNLESKIEAILFYKNEPEAFTLLAKILDTDEESIKNAVNNLAENLKGRGITIIQTEKEVSLATSREHTELIEKIAKEEIGSEIGKAGLETLSIILYNGPISRKEIDYIRGVNSSFILRNLSIRGLIKRTSDGKAPKYESTIELLSYLGINKISDLPEFEEVNKKINTVMEEKDASGTE